ncbi:hypothetical protein BAY59_10840 [Prauserella coralliicola]|nr:hypothetical protein BAY59_10840 [Prauserella coralliicola]
MPEAFTQGVAHRGWFGVSAIELIIASAPSTVRTAKRPRWNWRMLLPSRGQTRCYRCRRPWDRADGAHRVPYRVDRGVTWSQFALCDPCWNSSTPDERWRAHAWICSKGDWTVAEIRAVCRAIHTPIRFINPN